MFPSTDVVANTLACRALTEERDRRPSFPSEPERRVRRGPQPLGLPERRGLAGVIGRIVRRSPERAA